MLLLTEINSSSLLNSMCSTHRNWFKCIIQTSTWWTGSEELTFRLSTKHKRHHPSMTWRSSPSLELSLLSSSSYSCSQWSFAELALQRKLLRSKHTLVLSSKDGPGTWPLDQLISVTSKLSLPVELNTLFGLLNPSMVISLTKDGPLDLQSLYSLYQFSSLRSFTKTEIIFRPKKLETSSTTCTLISTWIDLHPPSTTYQSPCSEESCS